MPASKRKATGPARPEPEPARPEPVVRDPEPVADEPEPAVTEAAAVAEAAVAKEAPDEPAFANRAERRARGRGRTPPPKAQKGHYPTDRGSVSGPRMWGNRRSG